MYAKHAKGCIINRDTGWEKDAANLARGEDTPVSLFDYERR